MTKKSFLLTVVILALGIFPFQRGTLLAGDDDELFILPGEGGGKKEEKPKKQTQFEKAQPKLPPKYYPPKEWESFKSTALITSAVVWRNYLWAGTESGGVIRWQIFGGSYRFFIPKIGKLPIRKILAIAATPRGDIWIGTNGYGVARWNRETGDWTFYRRRNGIPDDVVQAVAWAGNALWIGTRTGIARFKGKRWRKWTTRNGLPSSDIRAIGQDNTGRVWFSPNISRPFYKSGSRFVRPSNLSVIGATCIVSDRKGGLWFCTDQGAVHYTSSGVEKRYTPAEGLASSTVNSIYVDAGSGVWVGTSKGLNYFSGGKWLKLTRADGLQGEQIKAVAGAAGGTIVIATYLSGAARYQNNRWYRLGLGIVGNQIRTIKASYDGSVWVGTSSGVSRYHRGYWYNFTDILPHPDVRAITFDPGGRVWLGTYGGGAVLYDGKEWKVFDVMNGMASNRIVASALTPEGLWFAHEVKGMSRYDGEKWHTYGKTKTRGLLPSPYPTTAMIADKNFDLWIATKGGGVIIRKYRGSWKRFPHLRPGSSGGAVYALAADEEGGIWFGTKGGLYHYRDGKIKRFTTDDGLPDNRVLSIGIEGKNIWLGTPKGVACFNGLTWRRFTREDGLISDQISVIGITVFGEKWFGSKFDGLTIYRGL